MKTKTPNIKELRQAIADYIRSEGCGCCSDYEGHKTAKVRIAELLDVPMYKDGSGYDFKQFET